jgi:alanine racemase
LSFQHPRLPIGGQAASSVQLQGLYTHFANAKNPAFPKDTRAQIAEFEQWIMAFKKAGLKPLVHAAATASTMLFPETHYDMVRIGIGLYGLWPAREVREFLKDKITLRPALEWKSIVSEIKKLPKGARIGYDLTEALQKKESTVAIIPVGYWHGYSRALSSIGRVVIKEIECKVLGRVSMDMLIVDVTKVKNLRIGEEVTIIEKNQESPASAESISLITDSSWYEVVTRLNPLIKRIYI